MKNKGKDVNGKSAHRVADPTKNAGLNRRSFLQTALAGGAVGSTAYISLAHDLFAAEGGPIVIGHQCELTGGFSSWGYWHDKCAKAAVKLINEGGGIAGRKLEMAVADT